MSLDASASESPGMPNGGSTAYRSRMHAAVFAPLEEEGKAALIERRIAHGISAGVLRDGERLPAENDLAASFGVALVTVRDALGALRDRGLILTRRGRGGGSFVTVSPWESARANERRLAAMPQVAIHDLGIHYRMVTTGCAELAAERATAAELEVLVEILQTSRDLPGSDWRRTATDVQLELAALSQSARLTRLHLAVQAEFVPLLSLQDADAAARHRNHDVLLRQIEATASRDAARVRAVVAESVDLSVVWLITRRRELLAGDREHLDVGVGRHWDEWVGASRRTR